MATSSAGAILRGDLNIVVTEAGMRDDFYIGAKIFPPFPSNVKSTQYPVFKKALGELLNNDVGVRQPGSSYPRVNRTYENDTFDCVDRGLEEVVDDTYAADMGRFFDAEVIASKNVRSQILLAHDIRVSAALIATGTFTTTNSTVAYTAALGTTNSFVADILAAISRLKAKGEAPNTIVMSDPVWARITQALLFQNWMRGSRPSDSTLNITTSTAANSFAEQGITQFLVGSAVFNSAKKGQAFVSSPVWPNTHIWVGKVAANPMNAGVGNTFVWNQEGGLFVSETYREEARRSNIVRVRQNTAEKVVNAAAGELIATQYS